MQLLYNIWPPIQSMWWHCTVTWICTNNVKCIHCLLKSFIKWNLMSKATIWQSQVSAIPGTEDRRQELSLVKPKRNIWVSCPILACKPSPSSLAWPFFFPPDISLNAFWNGRLLGSLPSVWHFSLILPLPWKEGQACRNGVHSFLIPFGFALKQAWDSIPPCATQSTTLVTC